MTTQTAPHTLEAKKLTLAYGNKVIADQLDLLIDRPQMISIIGPNGAGKSTVLKALSRLLSPSRGQVLLDGKELKNLNGKIVAQTIGVLPQSAFAPMDLLVKDLVACGRTPYQGRFSTLTLEDDQIIQESMEQTGVTQFAYRSIGSLSGGERQRVWLAMALAQKPDILLLDEPTTFLDIHHQLEMMELVRKLHRNLGITVVMVLHDLNHAVRYSDRIIAIKDGKVFADGPVADVLTEENFERIYGVKATRLNLKQDEEEYCVFIPHTVTRSGSSEHS